jgi:tRNA pseudouridine32 synthase/23S rRNA pseudouridine746 synthase
VKTPLATRDGVAPSCVSLPAGTWPTMLDFLLQRFAAIAESEWLRRMAELELVDEFGVPVTPERRYQPHIRLYYYRSLAHEPRIPSTKLYCFRTSIWWWRTSRTSCPLPLAGATCRKYCRCA